jgi:hypothetical protein
VTPTFMQEIVGNLARASTSAGASASSMLSAFIAVGDEVILKSENRGSASLVGTVSESVINKASVRPVYRVRCASLIGVVVLVFEAQHLSDLRGAGGAMGMRQLRRLMS